MILFVPKLIIYKCIRVETKIFIFSRKFRDIFLRFSRKKLTKSCTKNENFREIDAKVFSKTKIDAKTFAKTKIFAKTFAIIKYSHNEISRNFANFRFLFAKMKKSVFVPTLYCTLYSIFLVLQRVEELSRVGYTVL
jgi:hypothetical protein